ncbi:MAG: 2-oxo-4-hydroxy-4-carboxy-5-ureidoimidazoline decarboxylase [Bacteroidota bacterium]
MTVAEWNEIGTEEAVAALMRCCGSTNWAEKMVARRPFGEVTDVMEAARAVWYDACGEADWLEAFTHHPKIGDVEKLREKFAATADWSGNEQAGVNVASEEVLQRLAKGNDDYEEKFGYIFIVCATGKSAAEMLELLETRLPNLPEDEIHIAMGQQHLITEIRLNKLFQ